VALNVGTSTALRVASADAGPPPRGLWRYRVDRRLSLVGGALSEGGNVYAWCREILRLPDERNLDEALAALATDGHGLAMLPFVAGERAPGWRGDRRAVIAGLSLDTTAVEILAAALEAVALRAALVYDLLRPLAAREHIIVVSGGALARSRAWRQRFADALGHPLVMATEEEASSRGAALLALEALGVLPDLTAAASPLGETVRPDAAAHARCRLALERQRQLDARV
jgi:gluconokinase